MSKSTLPRLKALRDEMGKAGITAFIIPARTETLPHLLDSMIYYLTSGVFCYAKRSTKQTIYAGIQKTGD